MSIQSQIERIQLNRDIIRAKMVDAGQASLNDDFDTLTENLTVYPIDNSLSNMSENPVQNKVIKAELDKAYKIDDISGTDLADADYIPFYDSSASAKKKTLFSNLFDKLKTMTGATSSVAGAKGLVPAPALGDNEKYLRGDGTWQTGINTFANAFSRGDIIDTTERIVGMFMGKPLYQKVIVDTLPETADKFEARKDIDIGVPVEEFVFSQVFKSSNTGQTFQAFSTINALGAYTTLNDVYNFRYVLRNNNEVNYPNKITVFHNRETWGNDKLIAILRYTKTTDTANAIKYGTGNDYSLDEQIVGTWIDGKPIYQKVISGATSADGNTIISTGVVNGENAILVNGYIATTSNYDVPLNMNYQEYNTSNFSRISEDGTTLVISSQQINRPFIAIIQYTKTTD